MKDLVEKMLLVVVALLIGYWLSSTMFDTLLWRCVFSGLISLVAYFLMTWTMAIIKALKDPDVQIASELRISIKRYRHYQHLFDEYQAYMDIHGVNSRASEEKFKEILKQIDNLNEWRRYCKYRESQLSVSSMYEKYKSQWDNEKKPMLHSIGETVVLPVEGEGDVEGTIIGYEKGFYQVRFPFAVSIMPAKEPEGGWCDNDWPEEIQLLSDGMIDEIKNGILIGTTVHYHF